MTTNGFTMYHLNQVQESVIETNRDCGLDEAPADALAAGAAFYLGKAVHDAQHGIGLLMLLQKQAGKTPVSVKDADAMMRQLFDPLADQLYIAAGQEPPCRAPVTEEARRSMN